MPYALLKMKNINLCFS